MAKHNPVTIRAVLKVDSAKIRWPSHPTVSSLMQLTLKRACPTELDVYRRKLANISKSGECSQIWR